jgi:hypothetical protein
MKSFVGIGSAILCLFAAACSEANAPQINLGNPVPFERLRAEPYSFTYYSGMDTPERIVVRDAVTWKSVWDQINSRGSSVPLPAVNFSREMVVVAAMGSHGTGGFSILVEGAGESGGRINVAIHSDSPYNCLTTEAFTQPVDIARLARSDEPINFVERATITNCGK